MAADPLQLVHVVDDDQAVRESLRWLLASAGLDVRLYERGPDLLASVRADGEGAPGCALVDVRLPEMDGLAVQEGLRAAAPHLPVIVITGHGDVATAVRAMRAGARDFIEKPIHEDQLMRAVREALRAAAAPAQPTEDLPLLQQRYRHLSPREREVMRRVVQGLLNKQAANELGVSPKTVELHRANAMQKMGATSFAELVRMAVTLESAGAC